MIWDTPMLGPHDYNYTRGFKGLEFVRGQKGDWWITDPTLPIRQPAQPHKVKSMTSLDFYLHNHFNRQYEREYCSPRTISTAMDWLDGNLQVSTPTSVKLHAFRNDRGQWITFASEAQARQAAYHEDAPGPLRDVEEISFGTLLYSAPFENDRSIDDNPKNLIFLYGQFY
ncbi:MAG: hypothetical protein AAF702_27585 [Chloroflexota bacterium]